MRRRSDYITDAARTVASILDKRDALPDGHVLVWFFQYMLDAEHAEREGRHGDAMRMISLAHDVANQRLGSDVLQIVSSLLDQMKTCSDKRCET